MDVKDFSEAIADYQVLVQKETDAFHERVSAAQEKLLSDLEASRQKKNPLVDPILKSALETNEEIVQLSRRDYEELKKQLDIISQVHPELNQTS